MSETLASAAALHSSCQKRGRCAGRERCWGSRSVAENGHDTEAMARCFADNAIVRDEGRTIKGLAAIKQWKAETKKKYRHTVEPLESAQKDGKTVVTSRVAGNFPGSPVAQPSLRNRRWWLRAAATAAGSLCVSSGAVIW